MTRHEPSNFTKQSKTQKYWLPINTSKRTHNITNLLQMAPEI